MSKSFRKDAFGWGFLLWLIGYVLGFLFFPFVPSSMLGWFITPVGMIITIFVLFKKITGTTLSYYFFLGIVWTLIAIICDYLFLVSILHPADGYYKLDVYLYYVLTFILPLVVGWTKVQQKH